MYTVELQYLELEGKDKKIRNTENSNYQKSLAINSGIKIKVVLHIFFKVIHFYSYKHFFN